MVYIQNISQEVIQKRLFITMKARIDVVRVVNLRVQVQTIKQTLAADNFLSDFHTVQRFGVVLTIKFNLVIFKVTAFYDLKKI